MPNSIFGPFQAVWGGGGVGESQEGGLAGYVQNRGLGACAPRPPGFILLVGFGGALLVVSILGIVQDCHLCPLLRSCGGGGGGEGGGGNHPCSVVPVGTVGPFSPGVALSGVGNGGEEGLRDVSNMPRFPSFVLLVSFSDTLLVVSILDII